MKSKHFSIESIEISYFQNWIQYLHKMFDSLSKITVVISLKCDICMKSDSVTKELQYQMVFRVQTVLQCSSY